MLEVSLNRLAREGTVAVEASVPADDPLRDETGVPWASPVEVRLSLSYAGSGEIVARGRVRGGLKNECRRCLKSVNGAFEAQVTLVFADPEELEGDDRGDVRLIPARGDMLELGEAMREEIVLAINPYVVCDPECKGLCPQCGANLNERSCDCTVEHVDPRWAALRTLKSE